MATLNIGGKRVTVDDSFLSLSPEQQNATVDEIASSMGLGKPAAATQPPAQAQQAAPPSYQGGMFKAATEASHAGIMGGFDDEITAGMLAPVDAAIDWFKGDGFDMGKAYTRKQQMLDQQKSARREQYPGTSIAGELAGGLALGGGAAKAGLSLAAKPAASMAKRIGAGAVEGAGYGALYGAGEAKPGERLAGAGQGAAYGGLIGGGVGAVGGAVANRAARKSMPAAPTADDVAAQSQALYRASEQQGVRFTAPAMTHLGANLKIAAGRVNDRLRPKTAGFMDDVDALFKNDMSLEVFDEFRKSLNKEIGKATPDDARTLTQMKRMVDAFADNVTPSQMTGGKQGIDMLKDARGLWARSKKAEVIERVMDVADVQTGQYTQSGLANTITREMRTLYKQIAKGKAAQNWSKEEVALIRQMAKGGSSSAIVNLFAKFAPRGVVSIIGGQAAGSMLPGAGNVLVPLAGYVAGEAADRAAIQAAQRLHAGAATGMMPVMPRLPNRLTPLIPGTVEASTGALRTR